MPTVRKSTLEFAYALLLLVVLPQRASTEDAMAPRDWSTRDGANQMKATFIKTDICVGLQKEDGKVVWIPLEKLSVADQSYIKERSARAKTKIELP